MKKQLLAGAFVLASFLTAQAQVSYSFETSEGYTVGDFITDPETGDAQNGWSASTPNLEIVTTAATDGSNSLFIGTSNTPLTGTTTSVGAFGPDFTNVSGDQVSFSFDFQFSAIATDGSNFTIAAQAPSQGFATSRVISTPDGRFVYLDTNEAGTGLTGLYFGTVSEDGTEFTPFQGVAGTWYNIEVLHDFTFTSEEFPDGAIGYFIDGVQYGISSVWGGTAVENVAISTNNLSTTALVDNIIVDGSDTAGVKENTLASLSVFPNPANDVVNVTVDALVSNVAIIDLNGRTVKSVKFDGVSTASVNVSDLASGIYMMTVSSDKGTSTKKIVKN